MPEPTYGVAAVRDGDPSSPLFPFVGAIQDVAIYSVALSEAEIGTHFRHGSGHT